MGKLFREGMAMGSERDGTLLVLLSCGRRGIVPEGIVPSLPISGRHI